MISHAPQAFKISGGGELAGHRSSRGGKPGIQIVSLRALFMEIGSQNRIKYTVLGCPKIQVSQNVVQSALDAS
jgi:hypothetical protein